MKSSDVTTSCCTCARPLSPGEESSPLFGSDGGAVPSLHRMISIAFNSRLSSHFTAAAARRRDDALCKACALVVAAAYEFHGAVMRAHPPPKVVLAPKSLGGHGCAACGRRFVTPEHLRTHAKECCGVKRRDCTLCSLSFASAQHLKDHNLQVHFPSKAGRCVCNVCHKVYSQKWTLQRHKRRAHKISSNNNSTCDNRNSNFTSTLDPDNRLKNSTVCESCNVGFSNESLLREHLSDHSKNEKYFFCVYCDKKIFSNDIENGVYLQEHHRLKHNIIDKVYFCSHCNLTNYSSVEELQSHLKSIHKDDNIRELILQFPEFEHSYISLPPNELITDKSRESEDKNKFIVTYYVDDSGAGKTFHEPVNTVSNSTDHTSIIPRQSNLSLEDFKVLNMKINYDLEKKKNSTQASSSQANIKDSMEPDFILMDITRKENIAPLSEEEFLNPERSDKSLPLMKFGDVNKDLIEAVDDMQATCKLKAKISQKVKSLQCKICFKKFIRLFNLQKHMTVHENDHLTCLGCMYVANNSSQLSQHVTKCRLLKKSRNFACVKCEKKFSTSSGLRYHLLTHSSTRHSCPLCKKQFLTLKNLTLHIRSIHSQVRPHSCKSCPRTFTSSDHLQKHTTSTHTACRNYVCQVCGHKFLQSSHLNQHMWIHTGVKPHNCQHCPKKYATKSSLTKHLRNYHRPHEEATSSEKMNVKSTIDDASLMNDLTIQSSDLMFDLCENAISMEDLENELEDFDVVFVVQDGTTTSQDDSNVPKDKT